MRARVIPLLSLCLMAATRVQAQNTAVSAGVLREIGRARGLVEAGAGGEARTLLDSLVKTQTPGSNELAEALYWRATLAERATDAERDWKRLTIDSPLSPRTPDALVRLGEFEMLRGRPSTARPYFEQVIKDFPSTTQRVKGALWIARGYFDERNATEACNVVASMAGVNVPDGELKLQYDELGRRCANVPKPTTSPNASASTTSNSQSAPAFAPASANNSTPPAPKSAPASRVADDGARYSVQLAAYDTRDEAESSVKRLKSRGIDARIDGDAKPFRVRTGRYQTRAEAAAALAKLKKQGQEGFVAELKP